MWITKDMDLIGAAVYLRSIRTLAISDLHLGYEETLHKQGILVPKSQLRDTADRIHRICTTHQIDSIIINGDIKHAFGPIQDSEWSEIMKFFSFLKKKAAQIILVLGNHDTTLGPLLAQEKISPKEYYAKGDYLFAHGDRRIEETRPTTIIGHDHPAIRISDGIRTEIYKCHVLIEDRNVLIQPSFHELTIGSDLLSYPLTTPYAENASPGHQHIFITHQQDIQDFGTLADLKDIVH